MHKVGVSRFMKTSRANVGHDGFMSRSAAAEHSGVDPFAFRAFLGSFRIAFRRLSRQPFLPSMVSAEGLGEVPLSGSGALPGQRHMTSSLSHLGFQPEFDGFLFATIGEGGNGMLLSVVSALARLDLDPWQEAAALDKMPREAATRKLASLIAKLPSEQLEKLDWRTTAARLIALLPKKKTEATTMPEQSAEADGLKPTVIFGVIVISLLVSVSIIVSSPQPSQTNGRVSHQTPSSKDPG